MWLKARPRFPWPRSRTAECAVSKATPRPCSSRSPESFRFASSTRYAPTPICVKNAAARSCAKEKSQRRPVAWRAFVRDVLSTGESKAPYWKLGFESPILSRLASGSTCTRLHSRDSDCGIRFLHVEKIAKKQEASEESKEAGRRAHSHRRINWLRRCVQKCGACPSMCAILLRVQLTHRVA